MPHDPHSMGVLASAISTLRAFHPDAKPALRINNLSYSENFLYMLKAEISDSNIDSYPGPQLARVLSVLFILHAEYEMNCSTVAVRQLPSR